MSFASKILKDATLFFSRSTPNLATVIPAMDVIDERLTSDSLNCSKYDVSIRASLGLAKKTLNCYYNMTDWSEVYRIAMGAYSVCFSVLINSIMLHQSYIRDTSCHILRPHTGRSIGSTLLNASSALSLNVLILAWIPTMKSLLQKMMPALMQYV
jgi:hypothetical protein